MNINDLLLNHITSGPSGRQTRVEIILDELLPAHRGHLVEIGVGHGDTTRVLLQAARRHGRRVLVIDPFEEHQHDDPLFARLRDTTVDPKDPDHGYGNYPRADFETAIASAHQDILDVCPRASIDVLARSSIAALGEIAFAYVDGLQFRSSVLHDMEFMAEFGTLCICVDDYARLTSISEVPLAVHDFLAANKAYKLEFASWECYLRR